MVFSSLPFICVFLPVVLILHTAIPSIKIRNLILLAASLVFYAYGEPVYILLMLASTFFNYLFSLTASCKSSQLKKIMLALCIIANIGVLGFFKYSDMFVSTLNGLLNLNIPLPQIKLPIGISFFTFQAMSYSIDAFKGTTPVQKNPLKLLLYISFFPQLIAGPIVKYTDIRQQLYSRSISSEKLSEGAVRFIVGLSKKVLFANTLGLVADNIFACSSDQLSILTSWLAAISYMLQIFYDFSGYSDMAIGLGKMFGFDFKENFDRPYLSKSIREFWRRWHISLSTWFKEYLYIPLGGNRKGQFRACVNRMIVFFCTGLWHGASWTFVIWGIYHGAFLMLETYVPKINKLPKVIRHIYTVSVVCIGFVIFRADTFTQALLFIKNMFTGFNVTSASASLAANQLTPWFITMFVFSVAALFPFGKLREKISSNGHDGAVKVIKYICTLALLVICILRISSGAYNPFIYFRF